MLQNNLKFIVDESTGIKVVEALRQEGYNALSITEHSPGISDVKIIQFAFDEGRIIITNDKDFGELIYRKQMPAIGVILLRLKDERPANKMRIILEVLRKYNRQLHGNFIVATENIIRIRSL